MNNFEPLEYTKNILLDTDKQVQEIANAFMCLNSNGSFKYKKAFGVYPITYKVTEEQIKIAKIELEKRKTKELKENKNNLIFINMGMDFENKEGYINNYRVRSYFKNNKNQECFIEVGTNNGFFSKNDNSQMRCDYASINLIELKSLINDINNIENNKIHTKKPLIEYTINNLINIINTNFDCNFNKIYFSDILNTDDVTNFIFNK